MRGIRGSPRNRERTQEYQRQARHLLMESDPIGVSDTPGGSRRIRRHDRPATASTASRNRIHHPRLITRLAAVLAFGAAAPAAFATLPPPEPGRTGDTAPVVIHTVIVGDMPGGKIILIAAAAAALAAVAAVPLDLQSRSRREQIGNGRRSSVRSKRPGQRPTVASGRPVTPGRSEGRPWGYAG
jgi:hypothetical protein